MYKIAPEALASMSPPKDVKRKVPPSDTSTSKKRKSHTATIEEGSEEVSPVSHEAAPNLDKGKAIDKGKQPIYTPRRVTRVSRVNLKIEPPIPPVDLETPVLTHLCSP